MQELNWVERRACRESNLSQANEVWESVRTAIFASCESFNEHYSYRGQAKHQAENGRRVRVIVNIAQRTRNVSFEFVDNVITCTVDGQGAKRFSIASDENHAFLRYGQEEISADRLAEIALEGPFFRVPDPPRSQVRNFAQTQSDLGPV